MARTRTFDIDVATDQAMHLFWTRGYEGTTLADLTEAMGINRPSLYAAFGSKEALFERALARYLAGPGAPVGVAMQAPTAREVAFGILRFYADAAGMPGRPKGCLVVQGALACGADTDPVRAALVEKRNFIENALARRLEQAKREGDLPAEAKPADLARYVWTFCHGLSVQALNGASREQLRRIVDLAMLAWPASPKRATR